jgi:hypothetical protein
MSISLEKLLTGDFELFGQQIRNGSPDISEPVPDFVSNGKLSRCPMREGKVKETKGQRKKKQEEPPPKSPHANPQVPYRAILSKGTNYRRNATEYLKEENPGRGRIYNTFTHLGPEKFRNDVQRLAGLNSPTSNFNPELSGTSRPYNWRAHHLISGEAFYTKNADGELAFKEDNFPLVLQCQYDIDHGHNLILLPYDDWAPPIHCLIQHPNQHDDYSMDVIGGLKEVDTDIDALRGRNAEHDAIVANIFENLKVLEDILWDDLVAISKKLVEAAAKGRRYTIRWVRWRGNEKVYRWASLW